MIVVASQAALSALPWPYTGANAKLEQAGAVAYATLEGTYWSFQPQYVGSLDARHIASFIGGCWEAVGTSGYSTIQVNGSALSPESILDIIGTGALTATGADDPSNGRSKITLNVAGSVNTGWQTVRNTDLTAVGNITIPTNSTYVVAGDTWTSINFAKASTFTLTSGTGYTIDVASGTASNFSGAGVTAPGFTIPLSSLIPNFAMNTPFRMWWNVSSQNLAANGDQINATITNTGNNLTQSVRKLWTSGALNHQWMVTQGGGTISTLDATHTADTVLVLEFPQGIAGGTVNSYTGVMGAGTLNWPSQVTASANQLWNHVFGNWVSALNASGDNATVGNYVGNAQPYEIIQFTVGNNASATNLSVVINAFRLDYQPSLP